MSSNKSASGSVQKSTPVRDLGIPDCPATMWCRIVRVHALLNRGQRLNAVDLAGDIEVSYRTIIRTIEFMRDSLEMPVAWDFKARSFRFTAPCPFLPSVRVTSDEDLALRLMRHLMLAAAGGPAANVLDRVLDKFAQVAGSRNSFAREARPSVHVPGARPNPGEFRHLTVIDQAIRCEEELRLSYQRAGATEAETHLVHPLAFAYLKQRWVLVLHDVTSGGALRTFRLDRIHAVALTGQRFPRPANLDVAGLLRGNLGVYTGGEDHEIRILLRGFAADDARTCPWHDSQTIVERGGGRIEITLRLNNLIDIASAVLERGPHAEVLSPPGLRQTVHEALKAALAQYGEEETGEAHAA